MILGLTIERGFIDDRYPTYVVCDFDSYPEEEKLFGQHPLTENSIKIFELYNLLERIDNILSNIKKNSTFSAKKINKLKEDKNKIIEAINLLEINAEPIRDDDERFKGELKIPYGSCERYVKINTFPSKKEQKLALRNVNTILKG